MQRTAQHFRALGAQQQPLTAHAADLFLLLLLANCVRFLCCLSACALQGTASSIFYGAMGGAKKMSEAAAH
jgi:hypothetical protein